MFGGYNIDGFVRLEFIVLVCVIAAISVWKHKENIKRLLSGNENKIF